MSSHQEEKPVVKPPSNREELTKEFLGQALKEEYGDDAGEVVSFHARDAEVGVLSHVVFIDAELADGDKTCQLSIVAKFLKPEFPLEHMFQVESHFYRHVKPQITAESFQIPRPIYTSSSLIMIEFVACEKSYSAVQGCPREWVVPLVTRLGRLHAQFRDYPKDGKLAYPAGIGSTASGIMKETHFPKMWEEFLKNIPSLHLPTKDRLLVQDICQQLSTRRLSDIHDNIHTHHVQSLIHGDFHVANMLFDNDNKNVWLVDWAACGPGNPLVDLAFFAIVSLDTQVRRETETELLNEYYQTVFGSNDKNDGVKETTREEFQELYRLCLFNQFLIFVVYDGMARQIAQDAKDPDKLTNHFNVVNARACYALVDHFGNGDLLPRLKTKEEAAMEPQGGDVGL